MENTYFNSIVSIIIPIYNSELYLNETINSILNQTYEVFELLLINDGSTDKSEQICLEFQKQDNRISYYYKDNSGVSATRNYGISLAKGEYICFVDADDLVDKYYLEDLINTASQNKCFLSSCSFFKFKETNEILPKSIKKEGGYILKNKYDIFNEKYSGYVWNKLFSRNIIIQNQIMFNVDIGMCEDMLFIYDYLDYIDKVACIDKKNYFYRIIKTSASKSLSNIKWFSIFKVYDILFEKKVGFSDIGYTYLFYLYQGKYRLNFVKDKNSYLLYKEEIDQRIKDANHLKMSFTFKQQMKLFIYRNFNRLAFQIKMRKI